MAKRRGKPKTRSHVISAKIRTTSPQKSVLSKVFPGEKYKKYILPRPVFQKNDSCKPPSSRTGSGFDIDKYGKENAIAKILHPNSPANLNGLLLWHTTGSGKTCTALKTARAYYDLGWEIIWITRSTLTENPKKDVYHCTKDAQGVAIDPNNIRFMSYRTFFNALQLRNEVGRRWYQNNNADILEKKFLIFDEAHNLLNTQENGISFPFIEDMLSVIDMTQRERNQFAKKHPCTLNKPTNAGADWEKRNNAQKKKCYCCKGIGKYRGKTTEETKARQQLLKAVAVRAGMAVTQRELDHLENSDLICSKLTKYVARKLGIETKSKNMATLCSDLTNQGPARLIQRTIHRSYLAREKGNSRGTKIMLLSATPDKPSPSDEVVSVLFLINMLRPANNQLPDIYPTFLRAYGDGRNFTKQDQLSKDIRGTVSYLNALGDVSMFPSIMRKQLNVPTSNLSAYDITDSTNPCFRHTGQPRNTCMRRLLNARFVNKNNVDKIKLSVPDSWRVDKASYNVLHVRAEIESVSPKLVEFLQRVGVNRSEIGLKEYDPQISERSELIVVPQRGKRMAASKANRLIQIQSTQEGSGRSPSSPTHSKSPKKTSPSKNSPTKTSQEKPKSPEKSKCPNKTTICKQLELNRAIIPKNATIKRMIFSDLKKMFGVHIIAAGMKAHGFQEIRFKGINDEQRIAWRSKERDYLKQYGRYDKIPLSHYFKLMDFSGVTDTVRPAFLLMSSSNLAYLGKNVSNFYQRAAQQVFNRTPGKGVPKRNAIDQDIVDFVNLSKKRNGIIVPLNNLLLDGNFKEGIDLFNTKEVHIFEPQGTNTDYEQIEGRVLRRCAQKNLAYNRVTGWVANIYLYQLVFAFPDSADLESFSVPKVSVDVLGKQKFNSDDAIAADFITAQSNIYGKMRKAIIASAIDKKLFSQYMQGPEVIPEALKGTYSERRKAQCKDLFSQIPELKNYKASRLGYSSVLASMGLKGNKQLPVSAMCEYITAATVHRASKEEFDEKQVKTINDRVYIAKRAEYTDMKTNQKHILGYYYVPCENLKKPSECKTRLVDKQESLSPVCKSILDKLGIHSSSRITKGDFINFSKQLGIPKHTTDKMSSICTNLHVATMNPAPADAVLGKIIVDGENKFYQVSKITIPSNINMSSAFDSRERIFLVPCKLLKSKMNCRAYKTMLQRSQKPKIAKIKKQSPESTFFRAADIGIPLDGYHVNDIVRINNKYYIRERTGYRLLDELKPEHEKHLVPFPYSQEIMKMYKLDRDELTKENIHKIARNAKLQIGLYPFEAILRILANANVCTKDNVNKKIPKRGICYHVTGTDTKVGKHDVYVSISTIMRKYKKLEPSPPKSSTPSPIRVSPMSSIPSPIIYSPNTPSPIRVSPMSRTPSPKKASSPKKIINSPKKRTPSPKKAVSPMKIVSPKKRTPSPKKASPPKQFTKKESPTALNIGQRIHTQYVTLPLDESIYKGNFSKIQAILLGIENAFHIDNEIKSISIMNTIREYANYIKTGLTFKHKGKYYKIQEVGGRRQVILLPPPTKSPIQPSIKQSSIFKCPNGKIFNPQTKRCINIGSQTYRKLVNTGIIKSVPKKVSPKKISPKKVSPKKVSPKKVSPKKVSPKKVSPKKVSPKKVSPRISLNRSSPIKRISPPKKVINIQDIIHDIEQKLINGNELSDKDYSNVIKYINHLKRDVTFKHRGRTYMIKPQYVSNDNVWTHNELLLIKDCNKRLNEYECNDSTVFSCSWEHNKCSDKLPMASMMARNVASPKKVSPKKAASPKKISPKKAVSPKKVSTKKCPSGTVLNPDTQRCINIGSQTYHKLVRENKIPRSNKIVSGTICVKDYLESLQNQNQN